MDEVQLLLVCVGRLHPLPGCPPWPNPTAMPQNAMPSSFGICHGCSHPSSAWLSAMAKPPATPQNVMPDCPVMHCEWGPLGGCLQWLLLLGWMCWMGQICSEMPRLSKWRRWRASKVASVSVSGQVDSGYAGKLASISPFSTGECSLRPLPLWHTSQG